MSPWFGEALFYEVVAPDRGALRLHPSRVVRFLGHPLPDPSLVGPSLVRLACCRCSTTPSTRWR